MITPSVSCPMAPELQPEPCSNSCRPRTESITLLLSSPKACPRSNATTRSMTWKCSRSSEGWKSGDTTWKARANLLRSGRTIRPSSTSGPLRNSTAAKPDGPSTCPTSTSPSTTSQDGAWASLTPCKGTFPYDSDLRPPPVSSDVYTHSTIISSFIYLLLFTSFSDISDLRRCRGTYSIPPHPHSILYHSHSPRFYNLLRPALESHSIYTLSRHLLRVSHFILLGLPLTRSVHFLVLYLVYMSKYNKLGITLNKSGDYSDVRSPLQQNKVFLETGRYDLFSDAPTFVLRAKSCPRKPPLALLYLRSPNAPTTTWTLASPTKC